MGYASLPANWINGVMMNWVVVVIGDETVVLGIFDSASAAGTYVTRMKEAGMLSSWGGSILVRPILAAMPIEGRIA